MDILGLLPKVKSAYQLVVIMIDRFSKLTQGMKTWRTGPTHIVSIFKDNWIVAYRIPAPLLPENDTQFLSTFVETICNLLGLNHLKTTAYYH